MANDGVSISNLIKSGTVLKRNSRDVAGPQSTSIHAPTFNMNVNWWYLYVGMKAVGFMEIMYPLIHVVTIIGLLQVITFVDLNRLVFKSQQIVLIEIWWWTTILNHFTTEISSDISIYPHWWIATRISEIWMAEKIMPNRILRILFNILC